MKPRVMSLRKCRNFFIHWCFAVFAHYCWELHSSTVNPFRLWIHSGWINGRCAPRHDIKQQTTTHSMHHNRYVSIFIKEQHTPSPWIVPVVHRVFTNIKVATANHGNKSLSSNISLSFVLHKNALNCIQLRNNKDL